MTRAVRSRGDLDRQTFGGSDGPAAPTTPLYPRDFPEHMARREPSRAAVLSDVGFSG
jgi:hypothetical protein